MNIPSTPFIRNDYWPEYNDINQLNQRIDEVENEISLVNIRLSTDIENVSNNLNTYAKDQADTSISNNIIVNSLNANYAEGRFANFDNTFTNNAYIENLTVNKPVFDITLNTPHLENTTSLNGNFYAPNVIGGEFDNIQFKNIQNFKAINIEADEVKANKLIGDFFSTEPIPSSAAVGYDENGRLIPIKASYDVSFPEDADYLRTDAQGTARKGTSESEVVQSTNLIQAGAVQNMYDAVNENFNNVSDSFNTVNESFNDVSNSFNNVNENFNNISNSFNSVNESFNDVNNHFSSVELNLNNVESNVKTINDFIFNDIYIPEYGSFSSSSPVNYQNATTVELYGNAQGGTAIPNGGGIIKFDSSTNKVTFGFSGACRGIKKASRMFNGCVSLNQSIAIPNSVTNTMEMFYGCGSLNQSIAIPSSVTYATRMFEGCGNLNQNIAIPNSVEYTSRMFCSCRSLNQNIAIPNSVKYASRMFEFCRSLNQNIAIPNSVEDASRMFCLCESLNQNILVPNSVKNASEMFDGCKSLNQNILLPNSFTNAIRMFEGCTNLNQNIAIPNSVTDASEMFSGCVNLNQSIAIPSSVANTTRMFKGCVNLNQDIYLYFQNISIEASGPFTIISMDNMFLNTKVNLHNVHIPSSVPKDTSNNLYNCLVNGKTGVRFAPGNIINDLPVDPVVWPPV